MRPLLKTRPARMVAVVAAAAAVALTTGCAPVTTDTDYAPSDGVRVEVGALTGINLLVVADESGDSGKLYGAFSNGSFTDVEFSLEAPAGKEVADEVIGSRELLNFNAANELVLKSLGGAVPGELLPVVVKAGDESAELSLPIISGAAVDSVDTYGKSPQE
ncbi:hypothetical protein [Rarobacter faecitabidus]|uniref:Copper(I)-binding protein n=1 Tax=Rarobacter faecitabidus TaxID=13243 RepID=A0A542ZTM5_RARFA|nr:hypothetical protein [Rarobacter faecitabidus]TQL63701.1 hypothetical protein FB461_0169 [Rarobacter faecitabidus]